jgi:hypothetical protein
MGEETGGGGGEAYILQGVEHTLPRAGTHTDTGTSCCDAQRLAQERPPGDPAHVRPRGVLAGAHCSSQASVVLVARLQLEEVCLHSAGVEMI